MNQDRAKSSQTVVEVEHLTKEFDVSAPWLERVISRTGRQSVRAVDDVNLSIQRGETLALVGESGCGKSTFARLLAGLYRPSAGSIRIFDTDLNLMTDDQERALRRRVNMVFQDPYASLNPRWRVFDIIAEPLKVQAKNLSEALVRERVEAVMQLVKLPQSALTQYPHQFSGGQRQRISIARAFASRPEFLICDEPTSALDVSVQAQILNLMKELQRSMGMTYLFISHNLSVVHHMSDRVGVMYLGRLVELSDKTSLFDSPRHPYTRMLMAAIPQIRQTGVSRTAVTGEVPSPLCPPSGCFFHPRCPYANARCRNEKPILERISSEGERFVACHRYKEIDA